MKKHVVRVAAIAARQISQFSVFGTDFLVSDCTVHLSCFETSLSPPQIEDFLTSWNSICEKASEPSFSVRPEPAEKKVE